MENKCADPLTLNSPKVIILYIYYATLIIIIFNDLRRYQNTLIELGKKGGKKKSLSVKMSQEANQSHVGKLTASVAKLNLYKKILVNAGFLISSFSVLFQGCRQCSACDTGHSN